MKTSLMLLVSGHLLLTHSYPALAAENIAPSAFFDAATCAPPYSFRYADEMYNLAEKLSKADTSSGAAVYHLSAPITKDGFIAQDVFFSGSSIGVLVAGNVAEKLAKQYKLAPQKFNILNMSGFVRELPDAHQGMKELGRISLVALTSNAFKEKTLLACQFLTEQDRKNMKWMNR